MRHFHPELEQITFYLKKLSAGEAEAEEPLADLVYAHLQAMARGVLRGGGPASLEATALVNEVLLELVRARSIDWQDRAHFFRTAGRLLRRRFVDYVRKQKAAKRPPKEARVELQELVVPAEDRFDEILMVNEGLEHLAQFDPALAELVEMVYFAGIPMASIAEIRGTSTKTIARHLELARRWLALHFESKAGEWRPRPKFLCS